MTVEPTTGAVPLDLPLSTPEGAPVALGEVLTGRLTVVQLVRYFGCLPCQEWLINLDRVAGELALRDVGAIAIGGFRRLPGGVAAGGEERAAAAAPRP